jgi:hypothetical protein
LAEDLEMGELILSRRSLFELVWAKPMTQLARQFGAPPKHLAEACDRHDIPRPAPGHWQKLAYGKKVRTAELPQEHFRADSLVIINIEEVLVDRWHKAGLELRTGSPFARQQCFGAT